MFLSSYPIHRITQNALFLGRPFQSNTTSTSLGAFSHAAINVLVPTYSLTQLSELEQYRVNKLVQSGIRTQVL